ncbi:MAG: hypothetical protein EXR71_00855 [Myxococcales bacterium]|nr:hypothetical protein [Myxococcales bacterium]
MKIAAGCFGCLTVVCLIVAVGLTLGTGAISSMLIAADPAMAGDVIPLLGYANYVVNGCCCLSAVLTIALLAMGMSRGNNEAVE